MPRLPHLPLCNSATTRLKKPTSERYTLPPTPTRRSRCYQQLLCTRLADWLVGWLADWLTGCSLADEDKTKKILEKNSNCNTGNNSMLLLRQLLFTTRQALKLDSGFLPWRMLAHIKRKLLKINHGIVSRSGNDEDPLLDVACAACCRLYVAACCCCCGQAPCGAFACHCWQHWEQSDIRLSCAWRFLKLWIILKGRRKNHRTLYYICTK